MDESRSGAKDKRELYEYTEFPKNVRQIGVPLPGTKIYLEDYVITYLKQVFVHAVEAKLVLLLGKRGEGEAEEGIFLYGAIVLDEDNILDKGEIAKGTWDAVYETIHRSFSGAQILGWACGVSVWNSEVDSQVRRLQKAEFAKEEQILFLWDLSEKEEKIFLWQKKMLKELSGYYVYFEKNPQMQDFMLDRPEPESVEADYEDVVTSSMRHVIEEKEEHRRNLQLLAYCGAVAAGIAILFGIHMMLDSTARIQKMEKTVDTLSEYVGERQVDMEAMSQQEEEKAQQIPFESQSAENTGEDDAGEDKQTAEKSAAKSEAAGKSMADDKHRKTTGTVQSDKPVVMQNKPTGRPDEESEKKAAAEERKEQEGVAKSREAERTSVSVKQQAQSYIVQKGDTLSQIVWRQYHDLSYEKRVRKANGLKNGDKIYEGQCLQLPQYKK